MSWKRENSADGKSQQSRTTFENAKEATRRAAFLNIGRAMSSDASYKQGLADLFRVCRSAAIAAGAAVGYTEAQVDAQISELCDADTRRLKFASDEEFREFVQESGAIMKRFLAASDIG